MALKKEKINELYEEIELNDGINGEIVNGEIIFKKENISVKRKLIPLIDVKIEGNKIIMSSKKSTKRERKVFGSMRAHFKNIIEGLKKPFVYKLQSGSVHFPMTLKIEKDKNELHIKNFLGEKKDRIIKLHPDVEIKIDKDIIELKSADIEKAGMVAANIEKGTKIRNRDRRVFQDGIYIIDKPGRSYL